jgi:single-stranded-DNA-specific exonuclease
MEMESGEKIWHVKGEPPNAPWLARKAGVSRLLAVLLLNRDISTPDSAESFLYPRLSDMRDPFLLQDMDRAVELIVNGIASGKRITIYGDYDADGLTATALMVDFLSKLKAPVSFYIPHRLEEGYGINERAIRGIAEGGTELLITVDCGISSPSEIALAQQLGMEVVVTDHHQLPGDFRPICPTINPLRPDSAFPFRDLSGVGLAFYLAIAIRSRLRDTGFFNSGPEPDLRTCLDLVALGTVADIVPLIGENRIFVKRGLEALMQDSRPGVKALREVSGIREGQELTTDDIAFRLAPRLNALGRLESASSAVRMLTTARESEAESIAKRMNFLNSKRQALESRITSESRERIERMNDLDTRRTLVLFDPKWHRGVVGIVASKILEQYYRPTVILAAEGQLLKGSGRSIEGFNLYEALSDLRDLLLHFGGHHYAAGLTIHAGKAREFSERFEEIARNRIDPDSLIPRVEADALLDLDALTPRVLKELAMMMPCGCSNPKPLFCAGPLEVVSSRVVGEDHLRLRVRQRGVTVDCIAFGKARFHPLDGRSVEILFHAGTNTWQGIESIQLTVVDMKVS